MCLESSITPIVMTHVLHRAGSIRKWPNINTYIPRDFTIPGLQQKTTIGQFVLCKSLSVVISPGICRADAWCLLYYTFDLCQAVLQRTRFSQGVCNLLNIVVTSTLTSMDYFAPLTNTSFAWTSHYHWIIFIVLTRILWKAPL